MFQQSICGRMTPAGTGVNATAQYVPLRDHFLWHQPVRHIITLSFSDLLYPFRTTTGERYPNDFIRV